MSSDRRLVIHGNGLQWAALWLADCKGQLLSATSQCCLSTLQPCCGPVSLSVHISCHLHFELEASEDQIDLFYTLQSMSIQASLALAHLKMRYFLLQVWWRRWLWIIVRGWWWGVWCTSPICPSHGSSCPCRLWRISIRIWCRQGTLSLTSAPYRLQQPGQTQLTPKVRSCPFPAPAFCHSCTVSTSNCILSTWDAETACTLLMQSQA